MKYSTFYIKIERFSGLYYLNFVFFSLIFQTIFKTLLYKFIKDLLIYV